VEEEVEALIVPFLQQNTVDLVDLVVVKQGEALEILVQEIHLPLVLHKEVMVVIQLILKMVVEEEVLWNKVFHPLHRLLEKEELEEDSKDLDQEESLAEVIDILQVVEVVQVNHLVMPQQVVLVEVVQVDTQHLQVQLLVVMPEQLTQVVVAVVELLLIAQLVAVVVAEL
jgi:hypothetical protein